MIINKSESLLADSLLEGEQSTRSKPLDRWKIYQQGVLTNVFNPKVALFFIAFFPQFIDASYAYVTVSFLMLGISFAITGFLWCSCLAFLASAFSKNLRENPAIESILNKIGGVVFIGMGLKLLTEKS